jgi:hypothetical protein
MKSSTMTVRVFFAFLVMTTLPLATTVNASTQSVSPGTQCATPHPSSGGGRGGGATTQPATRLAPPSMICAPAITITVSRDESQGSSSQTEPRPVPKSDPLSCCVRTPVSMPPVTATPDPKAIKDTVDKVTDQPESVTRWKLKFKEMEVEFASKNLTFIYVTLAIAVVLLGCLLLYVWHKKANREDTKVSPLIPVAIILLVFAGLFFAWRLLPRDPDDTKFAAFSNLVKESVTEIALGDAQTRIAMDAGLVAQFQVIRTDMIAGNEALQRQLTQMSQQLLQPPRPTGSSFESISTSAWLPFVGFMSALWLVALLAIGTRAVPWLSGTRWSGKAESQEAPLRHSKDDAEREAEKLRASVFQAQRAEQEEDKQALDRHLASALKQLKPMANATAQVWADLRGSNSKAGDFLIYASALSTERLRENLKSLQEVLDEFLAALDGDTLVEGHQPLLRAVRRLRWLMASLQD